MRVNNAPSLVNLPLEMFDRIISDIDDRADLSSLSRTSKGLRSLTIELVFRDVTMLWTGNDDVHNRDARAVQKAKYLRRQNPNVVYTSRGCECPRLDLLLRSILENPQYGDFVQKIDLQCVWYRRSTPFGTKPKLPAPTNTKVYQGLIRAAIGRLKLDQCEFEEIFRAGLQTNDFDVVICLLIISCPNVTELVLGVDVLLRNPTLGHILQYYTFPTELTGRISRLQKLRSIRLGTNLGSCAHQFLVEGPRKGTDKILGLKSYLPIFYLPAIKQAKMSLPFTPGWLLSGGKEFEWPAQRPTCSTLHVLLLPNTALPPKLLRNILECTPYLTRLKYDYSQWSYDKLNALDLAAALKCINRTLKHFEFRYDHWSSEDPFIGQRSYAGHPYDYEYITGHCSLKDMIALETVIIPSCVLLGWLNRNCPGLHSVLPPSLVSICLTSDVSWFDTYEKYEDDIMPVIQKFVEGEEWRKTAPLLEEFNFKYSPIDQLDKDCAWTKIDEHVALLAYNGLNCQFMLATRPLG